MTTTDGLRRWAEYEFGGAELSDERRIERAITIGEAMGASPGASLPGMFGRRCDLKAGYQFFMHPESTPDNLQAGHRERVLLEMERPGTYLLLEDTSEIRCSEEEIEGLGPIGASQGRKIGFHLHSLLSVRWPEEITVNAPKRPPVELIGLADQQYHVRQVRSKEFKKTSPRRVHPEEELESGVWKRASQRIGPAPGKEEVRWVKVGDRGADIYDHLRECQRQGHRFVIRAKGDRALVAGSGEVADTLFDEVRESISLGQLELELRARPGKPARRACLEVSITTAAIRSPYAHGYGIGTRPPIELRVVRVWEREAPAEIEALEWMLLTDLRTETFEQASEASQMYATRWLEEEFHKALKTGMGVEQLQLTTAHGWFAATSLMSIAALRLINLREVVRRSPDAPAQSVGLSELELKVLSARIGIPLTTTSAVALAIGRLGGHLNRKSDGLPGWITLWRGWLLLQTLVEGVLLARKLTQSG